MSLRRPIIIGGCCGGNGSGTDSGGIYTNPMPMPEEVGGYPAGTTFNNQTMQQMWDGLLYPYQEPTFASFSIQGQSTNLEVGDTVAGGIRTFIWSTTNSANILANSLQISDVTGGGNLGVGLTNDGTEDLGIGAVGVTLSNNGAYMWRITGTNTNAVSFSRNFVVNWRWRMYYGEDVNAGPLVENEIEALRVNQLTNNPQGVYSFLGGGYKYICYPASLGTLTTFTDTSNNLPVPMIAVYTVNVTNTFGVTTSYNVHRTFNILGGTIDIEATF